jgi:5-methylcytosine-specific restriction endonuclease McrA
MGANNFGTRKALPGQSAQRKRVLERDPICMCRGCKTCTPQGCYRASTDDDHIQPLSLGGYAGTDVDWNHQGLCRQCHKVKSNKEALAARWREREARPKEKHPGFN